MTDRGTEYCGRADRHDYQLFLAINDIGHTKTKVKSPQTNGICEGFHKTILQEFYEGYENAIFGSSEFPLTLPSLEVDPLPTQGDLGPAKVPTLPDACRVAMRLIPPRRARFQGSADFWAGSPPRKGSATPRQPGSGTACRIPNLCIRRQSAVGTRLGR